MGNVNTRLWTIHQTLPADLRNQRIQEAAKALQDGKTIAFPTETVYGLGGSAWKPDAIDRIFSAKGRPNDNPLILHIGSKNQLDELVLQVPKLAETLMDAFWPGPLTLILPKRPEVPERVTGGLNTVAVRLPGHKLARELLQASGVPVAAPSANRSGRPSPTTAAHVEKDLSGRVDGIVDGGATGFGLESTVVDATGTTPVILRPGGITSEAIQKVCGSVEVAEKEDNEAHPQSPGMKYTHYAPDGDLYIIEGSTAFFQKNITSAQKAGRQVAALADDKELSELKPDTAVSLGAAADTNEAARRLYAALREADEAEAEIIFARSYASDGIGGALMNRLEKAAGGKYLREG
ncbi:translation factor SUA5 [Salsuginibacillus halophilus]|uniref:Threonylcarbamoyl-AMP synthase n=1 Tax=Salsuginibacillus halophilus TaxID=517424 RepID=A0A2P8HHU3_9BACI|nr:L-threonylcarbamoyladenylate synthase [Salsuginibacillus halophilus]PSL45795.1 translation factor SUA5 [Salsuginibacillus halophilus]